MFKFIIRAGIGWMGGFGRYLDLAMAFCLLIVGFGTHSFWPLVFAGLSAMTFAFDLGGMINRFVLRKAVSHRF